MSFFKDEPPLILQQQDFICASDIQIVNGNADIDYGGGGSGPARAPYQSESDWNNNVWEQ